MALQGKLPFYFQINKIWKIGSRHMIRRRIRISCPRVLLVKQSHIHWIYGSAWFDMQKMAAGRSTSILSRIVFARWQSAKKFTSSPDPGSLYRESGATTPGLQNQITQNRIFQPRTMQGEKNGGVPSQRLNVFDYVLFDSWQMESLYHRWPWPRILRSMPSQVPVQLG